MKSHSFFAALSVLAAAAVVGCFTGSSVDVNGAGAGAPAATTDSTAAITGDLPCDLVQALSGCASCHGAPPSGGAPNRLLTYDDLAAPSRSNPAQTVAQLSIARMKDAKSPMPPSGVAPAASTAVLEKWVADGMPKGTCGGVAAGGGYDTPSVCTSGTTYTRGQNTRMRPGGACNNCHSGDEGPIYGIAGTVYPTAHEPNDCNGTSDPNVRVVITDANGQSFSLTVNSAGNFVYPSSVATPFTAKVVSGDKTRAMAGALTDGDCNGCHTEQGANKAPGRIMAP
ncbi:hypothetical protein BH11MYX4_BH11MYX4_31910 [soil metagenome]